MVQLNDSKIDLLYDIEFLRAQKYNRSCHIINAVFELLRDYDNTHMVSVFLYIQYIVNITMKHTVIAIL